MRKSISLLAITLLIFLSSTTGCGGGGDDPEDPGTRIGRGMTIYVAGSHPQQSVLGGVAAIDGESGAVTRLFRGPGDFMDIAVSPDGRHVIFTEYFSGSILLYDVFTGAMLHRLTTPGAIGVTITSDGAYSLVVSDNYTTTMARWDLTAKTLKEISITPAGFGPPHHIVLTPDDSTAYITTGSFNHTTGYIAKATATAEGEFNFEPIYIGGIPSWGMAITPDGNYLYLTSYPRRILKVNLNDTNDVTVIPLAPDTGSDPLGIAVSPDGKWVYITFIDTGYVSILDTSTDEVVKSVKAGNLASDVAFTPDGRTAYVSSGHVYKIDCETQSLIGHGIDVGFLAYAVAIAE